VIFKNGVSALLRCPQQVVGTHSSHGDQLASTRNVSLHSDLRRSEDLGGRPVVKGTRTPVSLVVGSVGGGMTVDEVMHEYRLTRAQVLAALT